LVGPLTLSQLHDYGRRVLELAGVENRYLDFATVLVNNALWRDRLAAVPFDRRLLLLPKCLRPSTTCRAKFDELGLLCERCGSCCLNELQEEAERLGYAVLIAEGSAVVLGILEARNISAIIGVSCLSVLEKSYSFMEAAAIPGAAVPLLHDDCCDTNVDLDWVWDTIYLSNDDRTRNLDLNRTRCQVRSWFEREKIDLMMGDGEDHTSGLARDWLTGPGKRWRPFLTACTYRALSDQPGDGGEPPEGVRKLAVAVECFHKASLIHDDIEDGDACRYGKPTLHAKHGIPVALNVGDLLIGEGYRLIAECGAPAEQVVQMGVLASEGHRTLCLGQGMELHWMSSNETAPPAPDEVIRVFAQKTAPAFEVALRLAAYHQGASQEIHNVLSRYSQLLGIAYQIRDDVSDWLGDDAPDDLDAQRPSLILAMTWEKSAGCDRQLLQRFCSGTEDAPTWQEVARLTERLGVVDECQRLLLSYKERAIRELQRIDNGDLRGLLRRVIGKIFNELECDDWQCEPEPTDGCGGATGKYAAR
jgi:geranylgeranyl pyrophosphate synthase